MAAPDAYSRRSFVGNAAATTVPLGLGAADGSCTIASATNWPSGSGGDFLVVIDRGLNTEELAWSSGVSGTTLTFAARGAQGTSGVQHAAGCTIALSMGSQDLDEANQVVSAVLGQSGAAKGDIPVILSAAGPNTLTRVAIGSSPMTLGVSAGLPAWAVLPGTLLATQTYAPGSLVTLTCSTTLTALDATNATLAFTVPASGKVDVVVEGVGEVVASVGTAEILAIGLLNHSGGTQLGYTVRVVSLGAGSALSSDAYFCTTFVLTGLTPGALQVDLAGVVSSTTGVSGKIYAQGTTGNTVNPGPLVMRAFAA